MTKTEVHPGVTPLPSIETMIALHGARRVLWAALAALLRGQGARPLAARLTELDDHMRRDIGLPPKGASPPLPDWIKHSW
ncbi:hypothetical protein [Paenirhodobacter sp. CAU 1674]|uniref:hypothetical protein n=1 Tax=Paenirhodobacter sp. CAU 1674 TaxID=3032596 RepID=UPI0023DB61DA|nr:hypothetical protein [Paenirhodobacter sp. CAU 1674]MDF2142437.1 hypothetical protein [Paenirhodobacter sp. CAU 1674]